MKRGRGAARGRRRGEMRCVCTCGFCVCVYTYVCVYVCVSGTECAYPVSAKASARYSPAKFSRMARATGMYEMVSKNKDTRFRLPFKDPQKARKRSPPGWGGLWPLSKYFLGGMDVHNECVCVGGGGRRRRGERGGDTAGVGGDGRGHGRCACVGGQRGG